MSERDAEQGLSGRSGGTGGNDSSQPATSATSPGHRPGQRAGSSAAIALPPTRHRQSPTTGRGFELPPLPRAPNLTSGSFSPSASRLAGVSTILNPLPGDEAQYGRRRKASHLESPSPAVASLPPIITNTQTATATGAFSGPSPVTLSSTTSDHTARRILTPRSPSLHQAASLNQLNPPTSTINAQESPFPVSPRTRLYAMQPGTGGVPPLPIPPAGVRQSYGFSAPHQVTQTLGRAARNTAWAGGVSSSASPSTSYSSYSQAGQISPPAQFASASMPVLSAGYTATTEGPMTGPGTTNVLLGTPGQLPERTTGMPVSSSGGQGTYQMMTLETTSGMVQVPVDVQAASRVADEKRKRNAGASARFRQRRKDKEREASTTIAKLEQQIKALVEDSEFYKRERDYLASIILQVSGGECHFPRPQSPRHRRSSSALAGPSSGASASSYGSALEQVPRSPEEGRSVRRRTCTFSFSHPPPPPPPTMQGPRVPAHPGYTPQPQETPLAPQPPPQLQPASSALPSAIGRIALPGSAALIGGVPPHQQQQQQERQPLVPPPPGLPQLMQASPQTGPWNPYASERRLQAPPNRPNDGR